MNRTADLQPRDARGRWKRTRAQADAPAVTRAPRRLSAYISEADRVLGGAPPDPAAAYRQLALRRAELVAPGLSEALSAAAPLGAPASQSERVRQAETLIAAGHNPASAIIAACR